MAISSRCLAHPCCSYANISTCFLNFCNSSDRTLSISLIFVIVFSFSVMVARSREEINNCSGNFLYFDLILVLHPRQNTRILFRCCSTSNWILCRLTEQGVFVIVVLKLHYLLICSAAVLSLKRHVSRLILITTGFFGSGLKNGYSDPY